MGEKLFLVQFYRGVAIIALARTCRAAESFFRVFLDASGIPGTDAFLFRAEQITPNDLTSADRSRRLGNKKHL